MSEDGVSWLPLLLYRATYRVRASHALTAWPSEVSSLIEGGDSILASSLHQSRPPGGHEGGARRYPDLLSRSWLEWATASAHRHGHSLSASERTTPDQAPVAVAITDWHGELCPPLQGAMWSKYYRMNPRTPENVELAEWVAKRYSKRRREANRRGGQAERTGEW